MTLLEPTAPTASIVIVSKDEPLLRDTLEALEAQVKSCDPAILSACEVIVVDASAKRLDDIRLAHEGVKWIDFAPPKPISIAHQRNVGVRAATGDIIVFTDSGCIPAEHWLERIVAPIVAGEERMTAGQTAALGSLEPYEWGRQDSAKRRYLPETPTINVAFEREVYDSVGPFDESFDYGSDIDFTWRAVYLGIRIRSVPEAIVAHDYGSASRQVKRSYVYGYARARLFAKHIFGDSEQSVHKRHLNHLDAVPLIYPLYILGLPLALRYRSYLLLLLVPIWRARHAHPALTMLDHFVFAGGVMRGLFDLVIVPRFRARTAAG